MALGAEVPAQLQSGVGPQHRCEWDAWDVVRQDAATDAVLRLPVLAVVGAGKSAGQEPGVQGQDALSRQHHSPEETARADAVAGLCKPGAARSGAQSCAAQALVVEPPRPEVLADAPRLAVVVEPQERSEKLQPLPAELLPWQAEVAAALDAAALEPPVGA